MVRRGPSSRVPSGLSGSKRIYIDDALQRLRRQHLRPSIEVASWVVVKNADHSLNGYWVYDQRPKAGTSVLPDRPSHCWVGESSNGSFGGVGAGGASSTPLSGARERGTSSRRRRRPPRHDRAQGSTALGHARHGPGPVAWVGRSTWCDHRPDGRSSSRHDCAKCEEPCGAGGTLPRRLVASYGYWERVRGGSSGLRRYGDGLLPRCGLVFTVGVAGGGVTTTSAWNTHRDVCLSHGTPAHYLLRIRLDRGGYCGSQARDA